MVKYDIGTIVVFTVVYLILFMFVQLLFNRFGYQLYELGYALVASLTTMYVLNKNEK